MLTKNQLEIYRARNITDMSPDELKKLDDVRIDKSLPVEERIISFIEQVGNPYCYMVGDTKVRVSYADKGPSLKDCLENILKKNV